MSVFVLDRQKRPLMPCSEKRARLMLTRGRAVVHKRYPFTLRLKDRIGGETQPLKLSLDPGSKESGIAIVREGGEDRHVLCLFTLMHRGFQIREALDQRRAFRRRRRNKNLRHRAPRFSNRTRRDGWLPPSLQHRVDTLSAWVTRLCRLAPITSLAQELVRFDTQKLVNPEISGIEYQQGTLLGYEMREYLLEKWGRECAYCGDKDTPLEIEHIVAKSQGGSNRITNLTLACHGCNQAKGNDSLEAFFARDKGLKKRLKKNKLSAETRYQRVVREQKRPLRDASAVNATRWALLNTLKATGLPVSTGSGGLTKYNRQCLDIPKTHALDAACVGQFDTLNGWNRPTLIMIGACPPNTSLVRDSQSVAACLSSNTSSAKRLTVAILSSRSEATESKRLCSRRRRSSVEVEAFSNTSSCFSCSRKVTRTAWDSVGEKPIRIRFNRSASLREF